MHHQDYKIIDQMKTSISELIDVGHIQTYELTIPNTGLIIIAA